MVAAQLPQLELAPEPQRVAQPVPCYSPVQGPEQRLAGRRPPGPELEPARAPELLLGPPRYCPPVSICTQPMPGSEIMR